MPTISWFASGGCTVLLIDDRARAFWGVLGEVVDLTFETSKGRPCFAPPPRAGLICTTHETGIF